MREPLPRLDWCHLLPDRLRWPLPRALLLHGSPHLGDALRRRGVVTDVHSWPTDVADVDLLVVGADADLANLPDALARLAPGGAAYVVRSRTMRAAQHAFTARRLLRTAGLQEVGTWALLPGPGAPRRHVPLAHRGAWLWYLESLLLTATLETRAARLLLRALSRSGAALQAIVPGSAVMAVRPPAGPAHAGIAHAGIAHADRPTPSQTMAITSGYDAGSRTILLPFARGSRWPSTVLKIACEPLLRDATRQEHERLRQLHRVLPSSIAGSVPQPHWLSDAGACTVSAEEAVRGPTMLTGSVSWPHDRARAQADLTAIEHWLLDVHLATRRAAPADPVEAWFSEPLRRLSTVHPVDPAVAALVAAAGAQLRTVGADRLGSVLQHYDVAPWNVIRSARRMAVLDWELDRGAGRAGHGPPLVDLLYFACSWYFLSTGRTTRPEELVGLVEFFAGSATTWQARLLEDRLDHFRRHTGLPVQATWPLLVACWLERALTAQLRWQRLGETGQPDLTGLQYLGALAADPDSLVARWSSPPVPAEARVEGLVRLPGRRDRKHGGRP